MITIPSSDTHTYATAYTKGEIFPSKDLFYIDQKIYKMELAGYMTAEPRTSYQHRQIIRPGIRTFDIIGTWVDSIPLKSKDDMTQTLNKILKVKPNIARMLEKIAVVLDKIESNTRNPLP